MRAALFLAVGTVALVAVGPAGGGADSGFARGSVVFAGGGGQQPVGAPRILYSSDWSGTNEIYSVDPSGRLPTGQLTFGLAPACGTGAPCGFSDPQPSPDGRHILYSDYTSGDRYPGLRD
jgi:hypothetical protein